MFETPEFVREQQKDKALAIWSLIVGLVGVPGLTFVCVVFDLSNRMCHSVSPTLAIGLGAIALWQIHHQPDVYGGRAYAITGIALGVIGRLGVFAIGGF